MVTGSLGALAMIPEMVRPKGWAPAGYDGPAYTAGLYGIVLGWLKARFGPFAAKLFILAGSTGALLTAITVNTGSSTWRNDWTGLFASIGGAAVLATLGGMVVREYGRLVDSRTLPSSRLPSPQPDYSGHEA